MPYLERVFLPLIDGKEFCELFVLERLDSAIFLLLA
jgi:hypothetical protein